MPVRIGSGLSTAADVRRGAREAAVASRERLDGASCDVCVVFASGAHLLAPEVMLDAVGVALQPSQLLGCGAQGVLGDGREVEHGTAISVWAASLGAGTATAFHAVVADQEQTVVAGLPDLAGADAAILLADPSTSPADAVLHALAPRAPHVPHVPVLGGLTSAWLADGSAALFLDG